MRQIINKLLVVSLLLSSIIICAQNKSLTHNDYDLWKRVATTKVSNSGNLIALSIVTATQAGDGYLEIHHIDTGITNTFKNGTSPKISHDEAYIYFLKKPNYKTWYQEEKKALKKSKRSKPTLMVYDVAQHKIIDSITRVKKIAIPSKTSGYAIIEHYKDIKPKKAKIKETAKEKKRRLRRQKRNRDKTNNIDKPDYTNNDYLIIYQPSKQSKDTIANIKDYDLPEQGHTIIYSQSIDQDKADQSINIFDINNRKSITLQSDAWQYTQLTIDPKGNKAAYYVAQDSASIDSLRYDLRYLSNIKSTPITIVQQDSNLSKGWQLTAGRQPVFSQSGHRLFFYSQPIVQNTIDTTMLKDQIPEVDIWSYKDLMIQPEQKTKIKNLQNKSTTHILDTQSGAITNLDTYQSTRLIWDRGRNNNLVLVADNQNYKLESTWQYPWRSDYYVLNTITGKRKIIITNSGSQPRYNPDHTHVVYFNYDDQHWHSVNMTTGIDHNLTDQLNTAVHDTDHDQPAPAPPYPFAGFDNLGNLLVHDKYDIWSINLDSITPRRLTFGRDQQITYRTQMLDLKKTDKATYIDDQLLINSFNHTTKDSNLHLLDNTIINDYVVDTGYSHNAFAKAKKSNIMLYKKSNFTTYPDVYVVTKNSNKRLTNVNPQQQDYKWGSVELFNWTAFDGKSLQGLLYKPQDFDPNKQYPLIVYFYEKYSDRLHQYRSPLPSASIVNFTYLTSNDYVVFVPDIVYTQGYPGESAYNCIVSGTEAVAQLGYINTDKMALQGQSWGGYQTAYLVTRTNLYAAAMAGAPVANMTSAYGGIRWASGLNRAFQYEKTQSRLGKNLWDGLDLYVQNSPLFKVPQITTPLLIMHNDQDGAVPYYQGIELFMAMRRLHKPAWLLVYNNEQHNLRKMKNKRDLSIRMMQFFDHYLKDAPAPVWMSKGLTLDKKGKQLGYELD